MVTGHRPPKIGGYDPESNLRKWVREQLLSVLSSIREQSDNLIAISGMALGADQDFAESALELGLEVHAYIPGRFQPTKWPEKSQRQYFSILEKIKESGGSILIAPDSDQYHPRLLLQRNSDMISDADLAIAVWDGNHKGGTADAVRKLDKEGVPWYHINPVRRTLTPPKNV